MVRAGVERTTSMVERPSQALRTSSGKLTAVVWSTIRWFHARPRFPQSDRFPRGAQWSHAIIELENVMQCTDTGNVISERRTYSSVESHQYSFLTDTDSRTRSTDTDCTGQQRITPGTYVR